MAGACRTADRLVGRLGQGTPTGAVIFALNIDLPGGMKDAPKREGDCPIDTPVDRTLPLKHARVFHGASHLCKPFPSAS